jgi:uncharacterized membrane protein
MKNFLRITGFLLVFISLVALIKYVFDYKILSEYGKGFLLGKAVLLIVGVLLIYFGFKKGKAPRRKVEQL